jgi:TusA-related sulfurtransferase
MELDARGLKCPLPVLRASKLIDGMTAGETLTVFATDPGSTADFAGWAKVDARVALVESGEVSERGSRVFVHVLRRK